MYHSGKELKKVIVCPPEREYFNVENLREHNFKEIPDRERAINQHAELRKRLKKCGVEPIYPQGEKFDPRYHEAVLLEENDDVEPNTILDVVEPGWLYCEGEQKQVIKPAKVKVSKHPS